MAQVIAEIATNHGGDIDLACRMIEDAAKAGAHYCKFQAFETRYLHPDDPQFAWMKQAELSDSQLERLSLECRNHGVQFLATAYTAGRFDVLRMLSDSVKVGSGEAGDPAMLQEAKRYKFSMAFVGCGLTDVHSEDPDDGLCVVPLACVTAYPAPLLECCAAIAKHGHGYGYWGYSDHCDDLSAIEFALFLQAHYIECHVALAGSARRLKCDKDSSDLREICRMAKNGTHLAESYRNIAATARARYEGRWSHGR